MDEAQWRAVFSEFDKDGNGQIESSELKATLQKLGHEPTDDDIAKMMAEADVDKDGTISYEEFKKMMAKQTQG